LPLSTGEPSRPATWLAWWFPSGHNHPQRVGKRWATFSE
jgi:hypothetical protein